MATQLPFTFQRTQVRRDSMRYRIEAFFGDNLGQKFPSAFLHERFGTSFRTRTSEINRDQFSGITIFNATSPGDHSVYWAEPRP